MKLNRYVICSSCDAMNPSFSETCDQCGAPLNDIPADEPTQPEESSGQAKHFQRPTTLRLIGIWMIALPNVIAGVYLWFWLPKNFGGLAGFIMFWLTLVFTCVWFIIFYRVTRHYFFRDTTRIKTTPK